MSVKAADEERVSIAFDDQRVTYSEGHWNNYEDRQMYSNTVGSAVTVKFNGTGIAVIGGIAKNGPIAEVNIDDGAVVEDVDFFSASGTGSAGTVYEKRGLEDGERRTYNGPHLYRQVQSGVRRRIRGNADRDLRIRGAALFQHRENSYGKRRYCG